MISDSRFVVTLIWGAIALVALGAMFVIGGRGPKKHRHEDNYIHYPW